jgi:predicted XRE-type DNA-binding protein
MDAMKKGRKFVPLAKRGQEHNMAKLSEDDVVEIRVLLASKISQRQIAEMFGVKQPTVSDIKRGKHWT